jgi:nucleotide-binding universal stress UspA family protein
LPWIGRLARLSSTAVRLLVVRSPLTSVVVRGHTIAYADERQSQAIGESVAYLKALSRRLEEDGIPTVLDVRFGEPVQTILATAQETSSRLIALALCDGGDTTDLVLRRSPIPVFVARAGDQPAA